MKDPHQKPAISLVLLLTAVVAFQLIPSTNQQEEGGIKCVTCPETPTYSYASPPPVEPSPPPPSPSPPPPTVDCPPPPSPPVVYLSPPPPSTPTVPPCGPCVFPTTPPGTLYPVDPGFIPNNAAARRSLVDWNLGTKTASVMGFFSFLLFLFPSW